MIFEYGDCAELYLDRCDDGVHEFTAALSECPKEFYSDLVEIDTMFQPEIPHRISNWREFTEVNDEE